MAYINGKRVLYANVNAYSSDGTPLRVNSEAEMANILNSATTDNFRKVYQYTGETTENYEHDAYYVIRDDDFDDGIEFQELYVTKNGTYYADPGYVSISKVTVDVQPEITNLDDIPEVQNLDNPTAMSPSMVYYNGELYLLTKEVE